jgi:hypothetical protein
MLVIRGDVGLQAVERMIRAGDRLPADIGLRADGSRVLTRRKLEASQAESTPAPACVPRFG